MMSRLLTNRLAGTILLLAVLFHPQVQASDGVYVVILRKQEEKKQSRWSLTDWLLLKQKHRLMDQWLARNSSTQSPFEFYLEGQSARSEKVDDTGIDLQTQQAYNGAFAAFAGVVGLKAEYESRESEYESFGGAFQLRLLGNAVQNTNLILEYGLRNTTRTAADGAEDRYENSFAGVSSSLYLTRHFGLDGAYRHHFPRDSKLHSTYSGETSEARVFIDFSFLRLFGSWKRTLLRTEEAGVRSQEIRDAVGGGLRLFF